LSSSGGIVCQPGIGVSIQVEKHNAKTSLVFVFEEPLISINFQLNPIDTIVYLSISSIPAENYSLSEAQVEGNKLIVEISFTQSFAAS